VSYTWGGGLLRGDHKFVKYFWQVKKTTRSVGHHSLIIWTEEWAFLPRVWCGLLSTLSCICCKTGIPKLRPPEGGWVGWSSLSSPGLLESRPHPPSMLGVLHWKGIVLGVVFIPSQYISACKFYSGLISWRMFRRSCFAFVFSVILLYLAHCIFTDLHRTGRTSFSCVSQPDKL